jgi:two-component system, chemotaxis family, protein-glutamate methylesterase/glutaminase
MILFCEECGSRHDIEQDQLKGDTFRFLCHTCNETLVVSLVDKTQGKKAHAAMQQGQEASQAPAAEPLKVLVVDDSRMLRRALCDIIGSDGTKQVVGEAENGKQALELLRQTNPDVITLDINMPVMDGLTALKHIMISHPTPTVMISALTQEGALETFESLKYGAIDFLPKPKKVKGGDLKSQQDEILRKIDLVAGVQIESIRYLRRPVMDKSRAPDQTPECRYVMAFGAADGGYGALLNVIPRLRANLPAAYVAVMHQAPQHIDAFGRYLHQCSQLTVERAVDGTVLKGGTCYLASSSENIHIQKQQDQLQIKVDSESGPTGPKAIDRLMASVASALKDRAAGVLLTGAGDDGLEGLGAIIREGGAAFVQDPLSCLFKETPKAAINAYSVHYVVSDKQMSGAINDYIKSRSC